MSSNRTLRPTLSFYLVIAILILQIACKSRREEQFYSQALDHAYNIGKTDKDAAVRYIDSVFAAQPDADMFSRYRRYYLKKQYYFYDRRMHDSSKLYVDSMLHVLETDNTAREHPYEYALALNSKGDYYYDKNELDKAFEYYYKSRMAAPDTCAYANQTYHLGMVTYRQQKYEDAVSYFRQSLRENRSCGSDSITFYRIQELLNNIALSYTHLKQTDSASKYYNNALMYIDTVSSKYGATVRKFAAMATGVIYGNMGELYLRRNQHDTAERLLLKSIAINTQPGYDNNDALLAQTHLAGLYITTGRLAESYKLLNDIQLGLDTLQNAEADLRRRYLLYQYFTANGQPAPAFQHLQGYMRLKDSLSVVTNKLNQANVSQFLKNLETEYQLKLLTKDNELNRLYLGITIGLVLITVVMITLIYGNYKRSRASVQKLTLLNYKVNEQKEQLEYAMGELKKLNTDKDRILYVVAHDLKNPISGILALSGVILEDEMDENQRKSLEIINSASQNSLKLISKLLEVGMENKQQVVKPGDIAELNDVAAQVVDLLQYEANNKGERLLFIPAASPVNVQGIKDKIWRVISNLVSNAIKFSKEGSTVEVMVERLQDVARITVKDNGIGIPAKLQPHIFEMFSAAKRQGTAGESSFGLGLSITKQIIESHSGKLWFESAEGQGTTFFVELPLCAQ